MVEVPDLVERLELGVFVVVEQAPHVEEFEDAGVGPEGEQPPRGRELGLLLRRDLLSPPPPAPLSLRVCRLPRPNSLCMEWSSSDISFSCDDSTSLYCPVKNDLFSPFLLAGPTPAALLPPAEFPFSMRMLPDDITSSELSRR